VLIKAELMKTPQDVMTEYYEAGYSYREIEELTGIDKTTAWRVHRGGSIKWETGQLILSLPKPKIKPAGRR
jgi:hypothetical protein